VGAPPAAVYAARGAELASAERRAGAPHAAENAAATGAVAHAVQEGTFEMVLISGESVAQKSTPGAWFTPSATWNSLAPEPPASSTPPAPYFCR